MKKTILVAAIVAGLMAGAAQAQDTTGQVGQSVTGQTGQTGPATGGMGDGMGHGRGPGRMGPMPDFATLDANSDGQITMDEIKAQAQSRFAAADTNGDGALSADELTAMILARIQERAANEAAQMIENMDNNGDGVLQADEMQPRGGDMLERMFARIDTDDDGQISQAEFDAMKARIEQRMQGGRGEGRGGHGGHGPRTHGN